MVTALPCMITEHCSFCSNKGWTSPAPIKRIPQPVPDPENPTHFKVSATLQDRPRADRFSVSRFYKNPYKPYIF